MMDDEVLQPDRGEAIAGVLAHPLGEARDERREFEIRPIERDEPRQFVEREHAFDEDDAGGDDIDVAGDEGAQRRRHARLDLQPDDRPAFAHLERAFVEPHEVLGLLLDLDVAVANHAEDALSDHLETGKQQRAERHDDLFERDELLRAAASGFRQFHEALDLVGKAHQRVHDAAVLEVLQLQCQREAEIGNERKRMRRVDRERGQHGKDLKQEIILQPIAIALGELRDIDDDDRRLGEFAAQFAPALLLRGDQLGDPRADPLELFGRREAVVGLLGHRRQHLADQTGDAHHEEFVEIVG